MNEKHCVIAVIGATSLIGREVQVVLRERQFPILEWRLFDTAEALVACTEGDDVVPVDELEHADLRGVDIVFMCATPGLTLEWAPRAVAERAMVIDTTRAFADDAAVPVIVPEVNASEVGKYAHGCLLASPVVGAVALSVVLKPLHERAGLKRVVVAGYEPVSSAGREGIDELSRQTAELMNGQPTDVAIFPHRIAFNVIPEVGDFLATGISTGEWQVESQTRRLLGLPELPITMTSVRVPTFYGQAYAVNVETEASIDTAAARALFRAAPGVLLMDDVQTHSYPTLIDAVSQEATLVGRIRDDLTVRFGLNFWVAIDGSGKGGAGNAVQIAEILVRDYL
jgi:aspartate-semialdehyde dehydrogenase